jgi:hypothetical protein
VWRCYTGKAAKRNSDRSQVVKTMGVNGPEKYKRVRWEGSGGD